MKVNKLAVYDFETGSRNAKRTQPIQLSCVMIDPVKLEIVPDSIFDCYIKAEEDPEKCIELGVDLVQDEALEVNKITWDQIRGGVSLKQAWKNFYDYTSSYAETKRNWHQPIASGFNIINFDNVITNRLCELYGPWDETYESQKIFHPTLIRDVYQDVDRWTEGQNFKSISMDSIREWMGISADWAHNSKKDVLDTAFLLVKFLRLYRNQYHKVKFEDCFDVENAIIADMMR